MPTFYYKASAPDGEVVEGRMEASEAEDVVRHLQSAGQIPIQVRPAGGRSGGGGLSLFGARGVSRQEVGVFTQELATLLGAGLPLDRALRILVDLSDNPRFAGLTGRVLEKVQGGAALSDALEAQSGVFSRFYVNMIRAGELGGALGAVLDRLADYLNRAKELRDSVISALIYPAILVGVSLLSVMILLVFVVPQFTELFQDAGAALPLPTRIVIASGDFLRTWWWALLLGLLAVLLLMRQQLGNPDSRVKWDRWLLRLPLAGELIARLELARFSRTLGTLLGNGVPLLSALSIVKETLSNQVLAGELNIAAESLKEGQGMAEPLLAGKRFPKLGLQMIKVGEETGQLEDMLLKVAEIYDKEVKNAVQRMLALLEPLLIVTLGVLIAGIIVSILMAIISVNELAF